jgi:circadian clock protein KaiC
LGICLEAMMARVHVLGHPLIEKAPTGIIGLDAITNGGIPRGGITVVEGGAGAGKTILALQSLAHGANALAEPGIFVAFEEKSARITANAAGFWRLGSALSKRNLFFLDAQPTYNLVQSGSFDLGGMLVALDAKVQQMRARRIVFDAIDVVLSMLDDVVAARRELYRLRDWITERNLTAVITAKSGLNGSHAQLGDFMQFMVECAVHLEHGVVQGISQRSLRVLKYRGSDFQENEAPYVIGPDGLDVAFLSAGNEPRRATTHERVSSGVERLDTMLGGGFFRGAGILVTGAPGTAKTTLAGAFLEAACKRGERALFVSFDSDSGEVVRNLSSSGVRLGRYLSKGRTPGLLRIVYARALLGSAETHLLQIRALAREHGARCVVIDPVSALGKSGNVDTAQSVAKRLMDWAKTEGITLFCSSLLDDGALDVEGTPLQISTIADTWMHLSYLVRGGERNRCLSIIKSRGTAHSNQVRELLLGHQGISLTDVYAVDGEVLMGTLRWEREQAVEAARRRSERSEQADHFKMLTDEAGISSQLAALQRQLDAKRAELKALAESVKERNALAATGQVVRLSRRSADPEPTVSRRGALRRSP